MTTPALTVPDGARTPIGMPRAWLAAAVAAHWQCQCVTPAAGKAPCGRSHRRSDTVRCQTRAAYVSIPARLILIIDADGAPVLLCEQCAPGHARAAARLRAEAAERPDSDTLF